VGSQGISPVFSPGKMAMSWDLSKKYDDSDWWFGTMEFYDFPIILGIIIPTDSYFSEGLKPPR